MPTLPTSPPLPAYTLSGVGPTPPCLSACPHALLAYVEQHSGLPEREARALATEAGLYGWAAVGRIELRRVM